MSHRISITAIAVVFAISSATGALYQVAGPGPVERRTEPGPVETEIATWLLHHSVPAEAKARTNPLANDRPKSRLVATCSVRSAKSCHGYDGGGKTEIGSGQYPRPPALRSIDVSSMSDGEIFYHIRNGIRNTGMPAWQMPDRQIWQLVAFIRHLPDVAPLDGAANDERPGRHRSVRAVCRLGLLPKMP